MVQRRHLVAFQFHSTFLLLTLPRRAGTATPKRQVFHFPFFLYSRVARHWLCRIMFTLFLRFDSAHCQFHEHNHGHKYPSGDRLVSVLGMRVCQVYVQLDTSACILRSCSDVSSEDGNRQRQAYAHNNVAAKGCCQVGCAIERCTASLNPIRLYVWTTYGNARKCPQTACAVELEKSDNKTCSVKK